VKIIKKNVKFDRAIRSADDVRIGDKEIVVSRVYDSYNKSGLAVRIGVFRFFKKTPKNMLYSDHFWRTKLKDEVDKGAVIQLDSPDDVSYRPKYSKWGKRFK
jgi:hypothetical protein